METITFKTSGSTGESKSIVREVAQLRADAAQIVQSFPELWASKPPVVSSAPETHLLGYLWWKTVPEINGSVRSLEVIHSVENLIAAKALYGKFLFVTTPAFLEKMLDCHDSDALAGAFAGIVTSGSELFAATAMKCVSRYRVCPTEIFGSTETGTIAWRRATGGSAWTLFDRVEAKTDAQKRLEIVSPFSMENRYLMSDAAEFLDARHFTLLGRTDRNAKVNGEFVSLTKIESAFESHRFIARARMETLEQSEARIGALVTLTEEGVKAATAAAHNAFVATLRRDLLSTVGASAFPRKIRIVRTMPTDERGKTTRQAVLDTLAAWCREPVVSEWRQTSDSLNAKFVFTSDAECFNGHFPGHPILPGFVQLWIVRQWIRQAFADYPEDADYRQVKFRRLVHPGEVLQLAVVRKGVGKFSFALTTGIEACSSGIIEGGKEK